MSTMRSIRVPGCGLALVSLLLLGGCNSSDSAAAPPPPGRPGTSAAVNVTPSPDATPSGAETAEAAGEACVQQSFGELTAAQRAGQLVMTGVPIGDPDRDRTLVRKKHLGSVFLAGRTGHKASTVKKGLAGLSAQTTRTTTVKLLVSVDQEGGRVQSLRGSAWTTIPAATVQGRWSTSKLTSRTRTWVKELKNAGINMDLAPVADTVPAGTASRNPPIGYYNRQYGSTSTTVGRAVRTVTSTMQAGSVIPTVKHFPGLGRVRYNTDTSTRAVDTVTGVDSAYLRPFQAGIDAGAGAVMISSASYPKIDKTELAVFSSAVITDLLRGRMKYAGVVMTDDVGRAVAVQSVSRGLRATRFIAAGGDLVLTVVPAAATTMVDAIVAKAADSSGFRAQVNASTLRVLRLKQRSGLLTCR